MTDYRKEYRHFFWGDSGEFRAERAIAPILGVLLVTICFFAISFIPDPRPLSAPQPLVSVAERLASISEPVARAATTAALRGFGFAVLGFLVAMTLSRLDAKQALGIAVITSPILAIISLAINVGYMPLVFQCLAAGIPAVIGATAGFAIRKTLWGKGVFLLTLVGFFAWGISTGISEDVNEIARITGGHVLLMADQTAQGDVGFEEVVAEAFRFAEDNSHGRSAIETNKAVIVALGVILGEEKIAKVAHRKLEGTYSDEIAELRSRVTLAGRSDLPRHFWVSAALTALSGTERSLAIGVTKELMDATPGGSGFSFIDLMADEAGNRFTTLALRNESSARMVQAMIREGISADDFLPAIDNLPEGLTLEEFEQDFGGLRGEKTTSTVQEIERRLKGCRLLFRDTE